MPGIVLGVGIEHPKQQQKHPAPLRLVLWWGKADKVH